MIRILICYEVFVKGERIPTILGNSFSSVFSFTQGEIERAQSEVRLQSISMYEKSAGTHLEWGPLVLRSVTRLDDIHEPQRPPPTDEQEVGGTDHRL